MSFRSLRPAKAKGWLWKRIPSTIPSPQDADSARSQGLAANGAFRVSHEFEPVPGNPLLYHIRAHDHEPVWSERSDRDSFFGSYGRPCFGRPPEHQLISEDQ